MKRTAVSLALALAACGGKKHADTTPDQGGDDIAKPEGGNDGNVVPPETADEIQRNFDRKRATVSRCLSMAVDSKEVPKNSHGKITLAVTISRAGKAEEIKVIKATLESKSLEECVIGKVRDIQFPNVPSPYPTTYTYAFEAM